MDSRKSIQKLREELFDDVWSAPMIQVAEKYQLTDNGVRKRCKALNIPLPPFGYWAKKKAGRVTVEKPSLPSYDEAVLIIAGHRVHYAEQQEKQGGMLQLRSLKEFTIEELGQSGDLDIMTPQSKALVQEWYTNLKVPGRVQEYHDLISRHRNEIEYRQERDKLYPFENEHFRPWYPPGSIDWRRNESVIPIEVSNEQQDRAYRLVDTLLRAFQQLKARFEVTNRVGKDNTIEDNIEVFLIDSMITFKLREHTSKLRYHHQEGPRVFRPLYEEVRDGQLWLEWRIKPCYHYNESDKGVTIVFMDTEEGSVEVRIGEMLAWVLSHCCHYHKMRELAERELTQRLAEEKRKEVNRKYELEQAQLRKEQQQRKDALMGHIKDHATQWLERDYLLRYVDSLQEYLSACEDEETIHYLKDYIQYVLKKAAKNNVIESIISEVKTIIEHEVE